MGLAHSHSLLTSQEAQACPAGKAAMALLPSSMEEPWLSLEPHMPLGLNPEQAWAWALDNFDALCSRSSQCLQSCTDMTSKARVLRREAYASLGGRATVAVQRGQKRCLDPDVQELMTKTTEDTQTSHQAQWRLTQPADARADGGRENQAPSEPWSSGRPWKMLKTEAFICEQPGKE